MHETSIQLAEKILDCDGKSSHNRDLGVVSSLNCLSERIRNTLSHEMCHLACWIIDEAPTENHGALFKHWWVLIC